MTWQKWRGGGTIINKAELHEFMYSSNRCVSAYWVPGTVLDTEDAAVNTIGEKFWLYGTYLLVGGDTHRQTECLPLMVVLRWATWTTVALPVTSASDSKSFVYWYSANKSLLMVSDLSKRLCFPEHCLPYQGSEGIFQHIHEHHILLPLTFILTLSHLELLFVHLFPEPLMKLGATEAKKT